MRELTPAQQARVESRKEILRQDQLEADRMASEALWHQAWQEDWLGDAIETQQRLRQQQAAKRLNDQIRLEAAITDLDPT